MTVSATWGTAAVAQVNLLARPTDESYFVELRQQTSTMRYLPKMLAGLDLAPAPAGQPLLDAVDHLRRVHQGEKRRGPAPTSFVPKAWGSQLKTEDGAFDLTGYRLCTLDRLPRAIRHRDVFPVRSLRYADPRKGLMTGAAWEAARATACRTVGVAVSGDADVAKLSARLDLAYRETAARVPDNDEVTITRAASSADLSIAPVEKIDEPLSLTNLHNAVDARLPRLDCPELILEMHARTGFETAFTHASEGNARALWIQLPRSVQCLSRRCRATIKIRIVLFCRYGQSDPWIGRRLGWSTLTQFAAIGAFLHCSSAPKGGTRTTAGLRSGFQFGDAQPPQNEIDNRVLRTIGVVKNQIPVAQCRHRRDK